MSAHLLRARLITIGVDPARFLSEKCRTLTSSRHARSRRREISRKKVARRRSTSCVGRLSFESRLPGAEIDRWLAFEKENNNKTIRFVVGRGGKLRETREMNRKANFASLVNFCSASFVTLSSARSDLFSEFSEARAQCPPLENGPPSG